MRKTISGAAVLLAVILFSPPAHAGETIPPLSELRIPAVSTEKSTAEKEELERPSPVEPARRVVDPARLIPPGAVWHLTVPDARKLFRDWRESPAGKFMEEPSIEKMFRNNHFGLTRLFADLPAVMVSRARISALSSIADLSAILIPLAERASISAYLDAEGELDFLVLLDVGLDRLPAFEAMQ
ncbi:MAG: hypothetical protein LBE84_04585, partial [Planctomycetota bacterium]|nr:hypothetical protein [Planctomycetota bacterium]